MDNFMKRILHFDSEFIGKQRKLVIYKKTKYEKFQVTENRTANFSYPLAQYLPSQKNKKINRWFLSHHRNLLSAGLPTCYDENEPLSQSQGALFLPMS